jgi:hypothetical protein
VVFRGLVEQFVVVIFNGTYRDECDAVDGKELTSVRASAAFAVDVANVCTNGAREGDLRQGKRKSNKNRRRLLYG